MMNHTKVYMNFFGYGEQDYIMCESCMRNRAVDVHHLDNRGMGGVAEQRLDTIENLVGLCRECHNKAEHIEEFNDAVKIKHLRRLELWRKTR